MEEAIHVEFSLGPDVDFAAGDHGDVKAEAQASAIARCIA